MPHSLDFFFCISTIVLANFP